MTEQERLTQLLMSYGADPERWPEADRHLAAMLDGDPQLPEALLEETRMTDEWLDLLKASEAAPAHQARVADAIVEQARGTNSSQPQRSALWQWLVPERASMRELLRPALAACAPLVIGAVLGLVTAGDDSDAAALEELQLLELAITSVGADDAGGATP